MITALLVLPLLVCTFDHSCIYQIFSVQTFVSLREVHYVRFYVSLAYRICFWQRHRKSLWRTCQKHGGSKALILYGGGSVIRSGLLERVKKSLDEAGVAHIEAGGIQPNPRASLAADLVNLAVSENIDFVIGCGGGSVLDTAKAVAIGAKHPDVPLWDFYSYKVPADTALPTGTVMTFPATGSEGSNSSVLNFEEQGLKRGLNTQVNRPVFAILNPELTYTLPPFQTACGIVDMMSHIMERYFTTTDSSKTTLTDRLAEGTLRSIIEAGRRWLDEPDDYDNRATLMWASTIAHNNSLGLGRTQDWSCHALEHELSYMYDVAHGAGLAVVTNDWMRYAAPRKPEISSVRLPNYGCTAHLRRSSRRRQ